MSDLTQLYQEIILSHNKNPRNYRVLKDYSNKAQANNPLCGDEVDLYWKLEGDRIVELTFQARGCAISRSSASMMTELLTGKTIEEGKMYFAELKDFLNEGEASQELNDRFGELVSLSGVRKFPSRIKCATLAWHAFLGK
jgi:nitrogen fixation protein NifU and related proteins